MLDGVLRKLGLLLAALALFSIAGGHWAVLQTVAWAEMLRDYTQKTGSVAVAVEQTFDGAHPCELCLKIAEAKQQEKAKDQSSTPDGKKSSKAEKSQKAAATQPFCFACLPRVFVPGMGSPSAGTLLSWADQPPTPPPRGIVGA